MPRDFNPYRNQEKETQVALPNMFIEKVTMDLRGHIERTQLMLSTCDRPMRIALLEQILTYLNLYLATKQKKDVKTMKPVYNQIETKIKGEFGFTDTDFDPVINGDFVYSRAKEEQDRIHELNLLVAFQQSVEILVKDGKVDLSLPAETGVPVGYTDASRLGKE